MLSQACSDEVQRPQSRPIDRALRVLIVDDNAKMSDTLAILLGHWGFEAMAVHTGCEALHASQVVTPDIILLDISMPGMSGLEVAERLRAQTRPAGKVPFLIAVSGHGDEQTRDHSREAGIDLHLVKPVDLAELEKLLRRFQSVMVSGAEEKVSA